MNVEIPVMTRIVYVMTLVVIWFVLWLANHVVNVPKEWYQVQQTLISALLKLRLVLYCDYKRFVNLGRPITCPSNEHPTDCSYCTEMNCDWGMACARSCFEPGPHCCVEINKCVCNSGYARYTPGE